MSSQSILKRGKGAEWRIQLANTAIERKDDGFIYQQEGIGMETYVVHSCRNYGAPFDSACHRSAQAVWDFVENISRKPYKSEFSDITEKLKTIWESA